MTDKLAEAAHQSETELFWKEWLHASESHRLQMIAFLPIFRKGEPSYKRLTPYCLNTYFEEFLKEITKGGINNG